MNDDFLYKRQESPDPAFVAQVQGLLDMMGQDVKLKRKNGQRRFNWKLMVAGLVLIVGATAVILPRFLSNGAEAANATQDILETAQARMGILIPEMPEGFTLSYVEAPPSYFNYSLKLGWTDEIGCSTTANIISSPESPERLEANANVNKYMAQLHDWIDIVDLGNGIEAVFRFNTYDVNDMPNGSDKKSLEWRIGDNIYSLETYELCLSREEFVAIAQSTVPDSP
jgi:hypothetical protein